MVHGGLCISSGWLGFSLVCQIDSSRAPLTIDFLPRTGVPHWCCSALSGSGPSLARSKMPHCQFWNFEKKYLKLASRIGIVRNLQEAKCPLPILTFRREVFETCNGDCEEFIGQNLWTTPPRAASAFGSEAAEGKDPRVWSWPNSVGVDLCVLRCALCACMSAPRSSCFLSWKNNSFEKKPWICLTKHRWN